MPTRGAPDVRRSRALGVLGVVSLAAGAATACSLFTDLGGLSTDGAGPPPVVMEAGAADVEVLDAAVRDASTSLPQGCAAFADASFCADFDRPDDFGPKVWSRGDFATAQGTIAASSQFSTSPPNSALAALTSAPTTCTYLRLERSFQDDYQAIRWHASVRPEMGAGIVIALDMKQTATLAYTFLVVIVDARHVRIFLQKSAGQGPQPDDSSADLAFDTTVLDEWNDVTLDYRTEPSPVATFTYGVRSASFTMPADAFIHGPSLALGPYCEDNAARVSFDDVAVWLTP